ncbi:hypothetical protein Anas_00185 [Armadillidium nasatum]|uniref:Uncharacterized protein n=1 Tax=Armadillidium nasatum TaxID=96803 RepID=A0A5N5TKU3_9CRUS|nr:hypothetical protein Anas_00185 [Armadillidium nasatum]
MITSTGLIQVPSLPLSTTGIIFLLIQSRDKQKTLRTTVYQKVSLIMISLQIFLVIRKIIITRRQPKNRRTNLNMAVANLLKKKKIKPKNVKLFTKTK